MKRGNGNRDLKKYFLVGIVLILVFLSYKIISPYLITLLTAFILAYLVKPLYLKMQKKIGKSLSATICVLLIIAVVLIAVGLIATEITSQAYAFLSNENIVGFLEKASENTLVQKYNLDLVNLFERAILFLASLVTSALLYLPDLIVTLILLTLGVYYFLVNWESLSKRLKNYLPFKDKEKITKEISDTTKAIIYGSVLIAIIEFSVAMAGFYISGVSSFMILSILVFFLAFFPAIGPALVWIPLAAYHLITGAWWTLIGVLITGIIMSYPIDTFLRAKILGDKSGVNPFLMLIGILGGISVFGIFGFVIGPLILIYTIKLVKGISENR